VNGLLYVIGGGGEVDNGPGRGSELKSHVEIYDPATDRWSTGAPLPTALSQVRACVVGDQIYVFGGTSVTGAFERSILTYNPTSNAWSAKSPMPNERVGFECVVVDDAVYLVGGSEFQPVLRPSGRIERYDPFVETWSSPTRLSTARSASAAVVGKRIITMGGMTYTPLYGSKAVNIVEILDTERL
jgi:N-acetylneuraminic acid mutarotase